MADKNQFINVPIHWSEEEITLLLCVLCCYLVYPPMQLICCGMRICESCWKTRLQQLSQCPFCQTLGTPEAMHDRGYKRELERKRVNCPRCNDGWSGPYKDLSAHLNDHCDILCVDCNEKFVFPRQLQLHQRDVCQYRSVSCPLAFLGCRDKVPCAKIAEHYLTHEHQSSLIKFIREVYWHSIYAESKLSSHNASTEHYQRDLVVYIGKTESLIEEINPMITKCVQIRSERDKIEGKTNEIRMQLTKLKDSSDNNSKITENLFELIANMKKLLDEIKKKPVSGPRLMSLDSTFLWKVNLPLLDDNGRKLQSEPFHTSQSGYKLMMSCNIYLDGQTQKRYLSVYFTVLHGDFDAILFWPIMYPITISIMDLTPAKKHISHSISRESQPMAFERPSSNDTKPYCIQKFCSVDVLRENGNNYIQDEFIYLQIQMDFTAPGSNPIPTKGALRTSIDPIQNNILSNVME